MKKIIFTLFLLVFILFITPPTTFATHHICCSGGGTPTATSCNDSSGNDDPSLIEGVCTGGDSCDNSTRPPACISSSGPDFGRIFGNIQAPSPIAAIPGANGSEKLGNTVSQFIILIYIASAIAFIFMFVWGAFMWITSGGDKEALANARKRIIHAIIGIVLLALAFVIIAIIGLVTGFDLFEGQSLIPGEYQKQIEIQKEHDRIEQIESEVRDPRDRR